MSDFQQLERFAWFDQKVRDGLWPNASDLARFFEISPRTSRRAIDFMRDRLGAPLEFDRSKNGWYYSDTTYTLPYVQATQEEILAILIARQLLSQSAGGFISREIDRFSRRLFSATEIIGLSEKRLNDTFNARWPGFSPVSSKTFRIVSQALLTNKPISLIYYSPSTGFMAPRIAEPHHLQHYKGSWVLTAWCRTRKDWRQLHLARMSNIRLESDTFVPRPKSLWCQRVDGAYGLFQGEAHTMVKLRFAPFRARWIKNEVWHPEQTIEELSSGGLILSFPVADLREVKMRVLQYGADVTVIEPDALRKDIHDEIKKLHSKYSTGGSGQE